MNHQLTQLIEPRNFSEEDLQVEEVLARYEARESFWAYRQYINPDMLLGWWQEEIAINLHQFYLDLIAGLRPKLILESPPQMGKSIQVADFVSWVAGQSPELKTIYASFSDDLGVIANSRLQRIFNSDQFKNTFPHVFAGGSYTCNSSMIEYGEHGGSFVNTTVDGQVTGKGLNLGVVDDPIKGRFVAESDSHRNKIWNWFTDDFFTRFAENSGLVMILTRWHLDDPAGRMMKQMPGVKVLRYPALAERDERYRRKGDPLFPELKSLQFLLERKNVMSQSAWESEYQQNPITVGGGMLKRHWFGIIGAAPADCYWVRRWDLAATEDGGAYTAGVMMGRSRSNKMFYIRDVRRARLDGDGVKQLIRQTASVDQLAIGKSNYQVWVPQDPGQAGKVQARDFMNLLAGYDCHSELETGDKETRARPFAAQAEAGNVKLVEGSWNGPYLDEIETFPVGRYKDQVDASSGAFGVLILHPKQSLVIGSVAGMY